MNSVSAAPGGGRICRNRCSYRLAIQFWRIIQRASSLPFAEDSLEGTEEASTGYSELKTRFHSDSLLQCRNHFMQVAANAATSRAVPFRGGNLAGESTTT